MKRLVYGPLQPGEGFLCTYYQGGYYVLKEESKFGLYFGLNTGMAKDYSLFNITETTTTSISFNNQGRYLTVVDNQILWSGDGSPNTSFVYVQDISNMLPYASEPMNLYNPNRLYFPLKLPEQEQEDLSRNQDPDYQPTYNAVVSDVFFIPLQSVPSYNCSLIDSYGAYLTYSSLSTGQTFFTTSDYCTNQITQPLCLGGTPCSSQCVGTCTSGDCIPKQGGCTSSPPNFFQSWLFYFILGVLVLAIVISLLVGIYYATKPKVSTSTRQVYE